MVLDWEGLGFGVEVVYCGHFNTAGGGTEGRVLEGLEFLYATAGGVGEPDGTCICDE